MSANVISLCSFCARIECYDLNPPDKEIVVPPISNKRKRLGDKIV